MKILTWGYALPAAPTTHDMRSRTCRWVPHGAPVRIVARRPGGVVIAEIVGMPGWVIPVRREHVV
jgi:hypothetical protein